VDRVVIQGRLVAGRISAKTADNKQDHPQDKKHGPENRGAPENNHVSEYPAKLQVSTVLANKGTRNAAMGYNTNMVYFPLLHELLLRDAEGERNVAAAYESRAMSAGEWEALKAEYAIPHNRGLVCIVEFDTEAEAVTGAFTEGLNRGAPCFFASLGSRSCFFLPGAVKREEAEQRFARFRDSVPEGSPETLPLRSCVFAAGDNKPGTLIEFSFAEALGRLNVRLPRQERRLRDRLRIKELRRRIGVAGADEMRRLFKLLCYGIFTDSTFMLAKMRIVTVLTLLWDDLTGFWGGGKGETFRTYLAEGGIADVRETLGWKILHLKTIAELEPWAKKNFELLLTVAADSRASHFPPPVLKAMDYIQEHYKEALSRNDAADAARISPAHLSRLFSKYLNTTFNEYLTDLRIEKAGALLRETSLSVKEISFAVGFKDPDYFGKVFKKTKGISFKDARTM
jgi:two-component system response regulator YesN